MATTPPYDHQSGAYGSGATAWPEFVTLDPVDGVDPVNPLAAQLLPESVCRHFRMVAVSYAGGELTLAVSDPSDSLAQSVAHSLTNDALRIVAAAPEEIDRAIDRAFGAAPPPEELDVEPRAGYENGGETSSILIPGRLGEILVSRGLITEDQVTQALAR